MKRALIVCGCVVALAFPASAAAKTRSLSGTTEGGGTVAFKVKIKDGKPKSVKNPKFEKVPVECDQGPFALTFKVDGKLNVFQNEFGINAPAGGSQVRLSGELRKKGKRASGTFREFGTIEGKTNCDTGQVEWRAAR